jgi:putative addiction module killer protein
MIEVRQTEKFSDWVGKLRDIRARAKVLTRIRRMEGGNFGDVAPVGEGISEMRIHYGPGYRVYFVQDGEQIVILLCGGDKSTQDKDIASAKDMAKEL